MCENERQEGERVELRVRVKCARTKPEKAVTQLRKGSALPSTRASSNLDTEEAKSKQIRVIGIQGVNSPTHDEFLVEIPLSSRLTALKSSYVEIAVLMLNGAE